MLELFEPVVQRYFAASFDTPTPVQRASWPVIARGEHVLITAPTGSGKTLTAFLWALNKYARGDLQPGVTSIVYISPMKALNNDIRKNLLEPLAALPTHGKFAELNVQTRSGDTPPNERQRMLRHPPEILITTPESLSLLLTSVRGRQMLSHVDTLILDEVHSIVTNRRGVQLLCALERLCWMGLEPQRIALSATVKPLQRVAQQVAGFSAPGERRAMVTISADQHKAIDFHVKLPEGALEVTAQGKKIWEPLTDAFRKRLRANSSTLFFVNSRRLAEKITLQLNQDNTTVLAYAHHGSLAKDIRYAVEQKLKDGKLRAIIATSSLELGIDIGNLDEVVLIQSPPSVSAALQRIGRSGHRVGETSIGTLFPTHAHDFLEAAALSVAINARDIEPLQIPQNPLDLLAQLIIATTASEDWDVDELFALIIKAAPYATLKRDHYDSVVEMLAGRYAGMRLRDLRPRVTFDRLNNRLRATRGAVMAYYSSGGTIPDRGYFKLRHANTNQVIGELDEEFVWEARVGETLNLGTGHWQIARITHDDVLVNPAPAHVSAPPFWRSESVNRDFHFSSHIASVLDHAERTLSEQRGDQLASVLIEDSGFDAAAADALVSYLKRQREHSGVLPGSRRILLEQINSGPSGYRSSGGERQLVIHTFWGARVNRPFGLALGNAWRERFGTPPELQVDNDALIIQLTHDIDPAEVISLVTADNLGAHLRDALEDSPFFGARFRECAGRSLLLTRKRFNQRLPLWMMRMQSKKLLSAIKPLTDFPVLLEAWRTCLEDEFDLDNLERLLIDLQDGEISWRFVECASPSPFAANLSWQQINQYMYADDTPETRGRSNLDDELITSAFAQRPSVSRAVVTEFLAKRQRQHVDYAPEDLGEWLEWIKERVLLPKTEIEQTLQAGLRNELFASSLLVTLSEKGNGEKGNGEKGNEETAKGVSGKGLERQWLCHAENAQALIATFSLAPKDGSSFSEHEELRDLPMFTQELLSFYGPLTEAELTQLLPSAALPALLDAPYLLRGALITDNAVERFCDVDNFEILLRFQRRASRPTLEPRPIVDWPGWLAHWHNASAASADSTLDSLRGYSAPVGVWLHELLPPRLARDVNDTRDPTTASSAELARAFVAQDMGWVGTGVERIAIDYAEELSRHRSTSSHPDTQSATEQNADNSAQLRERFADPRARYAFTQLLDAEHTQAMSPAEFNTTLWEGVWRGQLTNDTLDSLMIAGRASYKLAGHSNSRRARRVSWPGAWSLIQPAVADTDPVAADPLERLEASKQAARTLLDRYGVLARELANREGGPYRWRELFSALRVMELAGEVVAGAFFTTFSGPQFATPQAVRDFQAAWTPRDAWLSVFDPASPSGMGLDWPEHTLPHRRAGNHLALVGGKISLLSEANGSRLTFLTAPMDTATDRACELLTQLCRTAPRIALKEINGESARVSPYLNVLEAHFKLQRDHKGVYIEQPLG